MCDDSWKRKKDRERLKKKMKWVEKGICIHNLSRYYTSIQQMSGVENMLTPRGDP